MAGKRAIGPDGREPAGGPTGGRRVAVEADLDLSVDGEPVRVRGDGDLVVIDAPSLATLRAFRAGVDALPGPVATDGSSASVVAAAADAGPTVEVRVRGTSVARIVPGGAPGILGTLLGTAPARPQLGGLVRAILGR